MKILIVEDSKLFRDTLRKLMSSYGVSTTVENGVEALKAFEDQLQHDDPFDLVFLDIMMPEMDGETALNSLRIIEDNYGIGGLDRARIVMTTSIEDPKTIMRTFKDQADGYLLKPVQEKKLVGLMKYLHLIE